MKENKGIQTEVKNDKLVISVPIDTLVIAYENNETNYKEDGPASTIKDKIDFSETVAQYIEEYGREDESGLSALERLFDEIFDEMYSDAVDCIEYEED